MTSRVLFILNIPIAGEQHAVVAWRHGKMVRFRVSREDVARGIGKFNRHAVRPGRKIGHVNLVGSSTEEVDTVRQRAARVAAIIRDGRVPAEESARISEENV